MQYRVDPRSGNKLSVLGFGCMRFSKSLSASFGLKVGKAFDEKKIEKLLVEAVDAGVNYFDTAYLYAGSEEFLGTVLRKHGLRDQVYIATKFPLMFARKAGDLDKYFDAELKRLKTDHIDYYLFHMLSDMDTWRKLCGWKVEEWIAGKKASGQIRQIGFSFHGPREAFMDLLDAYDWDFVQIQYNYSDAHFQAGTAGLKAAAAKGIPVMIMEPLLGGRLADGLPETAVRRFRDEDPDTTPAQWGLKWVWNHPEVTVVLSGMNEPQQLADNLAAADTAAAGSLTAAELGVFEDVRKRFNASYKIHCTGCHYCMPCPAGVNIPGCFSAYNTYHGISPSTGRLQYGMTTLLSGSPGYASLCKKCGKCERQCPQHLPIRDSLEEVQKSMEDVRFQAMKAGAGLFMNKGDKAADTFKDGKRTLIYCFSGTGNSLALARMIGENLGRTDIRGMMTLREDPAIPAEYDRIGFVLPTCFGHPPKVVTEIGDTLLFASHQRVFIAVTCGGSNILTLSDFRNQLEPKTAHAVQGFSVRLPGNHLVGFGAWSLKRQRALFDGAEKAARDIACKVRDQVPTGKGIDPPVHVMTFLSETFNGRLGVENIHSTVPLYAVTAACTRCGVCEKLCPVGNIKVTEKGVTFGSNCQQCMACIQWCPVRAITHPNVPKDRKRYHHPDITLKDMLELNR